MKKLFYLLLTGLLLGLLAAPGLAAPAEPQIILEPQSHCYPEHAVAIYQVKVSGTNLYATWYLEWEGKTYVLSDNTNETEPWEGYAGEEYGGVKLDDNTFMFFFAGIGHELDGAQIWCVLEDGHYNITSQKARIFVGNPNTPPTITSIPAQVTVEQGAECEIRCLATSPGEAQLLFLWYETSTGGLEDIQAVNRGTEDGDFLFCDTSTVGTRYYVCGVWTTDGGMAYSSVVPVTVTAAKTTPTEPKPTELWDTEPAQAAPEIQTDALPVATAGQAYSARIRSDDPSAQFCIYYNPGKANDFEKTGLTLHADGWISGTPAAAGSYSFCVCAANAAGEDYMVYSLTVGEGDPQATTVPREETTPQQSTTPRQTEDNTTPPARQEDTTPTGEPEKDTSGSGLPWLAMVLTGVGATGAGIGAAILMMKKKF